MKRGLKKIALTLQKAQKLNFFANNSPEIILAAENLEYDRSWTRRSVYMKISWIRPIVGEKKTFTEIKRTGMARTEKNLLDLYLCERAWFRSPEKNLYCKESDITNSLKKV